MNVIKSQLVDAQKIIQKYLYRHQFATYYHRQAITTTLRELKQDVESIVSGDIKDSHFSTHLFFLIKDLWGSSSWMANSLYRHLSETTKIPSLHPHFIQNPNHEFIIDHIIKRKKITEPHITQQDIYEVIFEEIEHHHKDPHFVSRLKFPHLKCRIVLVPGMLNELFKVTPFQRGVEHLSQHYGVKFYSAKVHGTKSASHNAKLLEKQIKDLIRQNPNEKLWLLGYSKGGIDSLHFLRNNHELAQKHILGLSTIASPLRGSRHLEHKIIKMLNIIHKYSDNSFYQRIDKGRDIFIRECQKSLSEKYQSRWFYRNRHKFPSRLFYSSLALESSWYEVHPWMILTKLFFNSKYGNDGVVESSQAHFPDYFDSINFGTLKGHHLIGARSSTFNQEALIEAHIIALHYLGVLK